MLMCNVYRWFEFLLFDKGEDYENFIWNSYIIISVAALNLQLINIITLILIYPCTSGFN